MKKILLFLIIIFIYINVLALGYGDINNDGKISSTDYILLRKYILKTDNLNNEQKKAADINKDNKINSSDYVLIRNKIIGRNYVPEPFETNIPTPTPVTYKATFILQDTNAGILSSKEISCISKDASPCEIETPNLVLNNGYEMIGWSIDKDATNTTITNNTKILINSNIQYYSITKNVINITYNVGEDIPGVNIKASSLSFYNNEHTKCISYNGKGCNIKWIPTIIAPGQVVHGFAKSPSGEVINIAKTIFNKDTTLYARIYDSVDGNSKMHSINTMIYETVGNVLVEVETGIDSTTATQFIDLIKKLYKDFPHLLMWNGTISLLTISSFQNMYGNYGGMTNHGTGFSKDFSRIALIKYTSDYEEYTYYHLRSAIHEIVHAYNYGLYWNGGVDTAVSNSSDVANLFNTYKNSSNRPLRSYSYNNQSEFLSDLMAEYFRQHRLVQYNDNVYGPYAPGWTTELTRLAEKINSFGYNYYHSIGRI